MCLGFLCISMYNRSPTKMHTKCLINNNKLTHWFFRTLELYISLGVVGASFITLIVLTTGLKCMPCQKCMPVSMCFILPQYMKSNISWYSEHDKLDIVGDLWTLWILKSFSTFCSKTSQTQTTTTVVLVTHCDLFFSHRGHQIFVVYQRRWSVVIGVRCWQVWYVQLWFSSPQ